MGSPAASALVLQEGHREILESLARSSVASHREVIRARVLLLAADGVANAQIAASTGVSRPSVLAWRSEYVERGLAQWGKVAAGRGRKASIPQATIDRIVELTLHTRPEGATHWSTRSMAKEVGVSAAT